MPLRAVYTDLDGTLLGRGSSLFRDPEGGLSLAQARALEACHRAGAEVVIMSGRREPQVHEAARLMGMDPLSIKFIRLAHERGLGCGDPRDIEIVGDQEAGAENWHFVGPFRKMTFAARMQHQIYWGPLRKPIEWSLKTVLAPWAYAASVVYHDSFWYPYNARRMMREVLDGPWGRLFRNWETVRADGDGYPDVGTAVAEIELTGTRALARSLGILGTCIAQAPEFVQKKRASEK